MPVGKRPRRPWKSICKVNTNEHDRVTCYFCSGDAADWWGHGKSGWANVGTLEDHYRRCSLFKEFYWYVHVEVARRVKEEQRQAALKEAEAVHASANGGSAIILSTKPHTAWGRNGIDVRFAFEGAELRIDYLRHEEDGALKAGWSTVPGLPQVRTQSGRTLGGARRDRAYAAALLALQEAGVQIPRGPKPPAPAPTPVELLPPPPPPPLTRRNTMRARWESLSEAEQQAEIAERLNRKRKP